MRYEELVVAIGLGFHPDTRGADYVELPEGVTAEDVDATVSAAFLSYHALPRPGRDPYTRALNALESAGVAFPRD